MGFFRKKNKEIRSLINKVYGGDWNYFVWNYANQIYNIPEVRSAIEKVADIFSSMNVWNERVNKSGSISYIQDTTQRIISYKPNVLQNKTQFYKNCVTKLLLDNNLFVEPVFDGVGNLKTLYPLPFKNFNLSIDESGANGYVQFFDGTGNPQKKYNLNDIIYINRFATLTGGANNQLGLYEMVIKSLSEQIVNDASPNKPRALLQSNDIGSGALKDKDKKGNMKDLQANFANNVQGVAYIDRGWTITPINWKDSAVNKDLMQFVVNIVYNYFGINENIINNKASEIEMAMFIKTTIKPLANQFSEEFTNKLFTENEFYFGRRIEFDWSPLLVTTLSAEASASQILIRNGVLNIDEARERIGYSPLENGLGTIHRASADLVNIEVIDDYELGKVNKNADTANINKEVESEQE